MTPRPYLSYTQMSLWERSPERYKEIYLEDGRIPINRGMAYGKQIATALESGEDGNDILNSLVIASIPKLNAMEYPIEAELNGVPLYGKLDSFNSKTKKAFKEYKTGRSPWTQKLVDGNDQITFYCTLIYARYGLRPEGLDIELVYIPTDYNGQGQIEPTGKIERFKTRRNFIEIMKMSARQKKAWEGIEKMCIDFASDIPILE